MQKLLNEPARYVDDALEGILAAHGDVLEALPHEPRAVIRRGASTRDKVGIVTGGGSGHLPLFLGYVGEGLADGCAVGNLFASPSAMQMLAVIRAVSTGRGVLQLYGNYSGDRLNFDIAAELAAADDITCVAARGADDVASADAPDERRGIAGIAFAYMTAGAHAEEGAPLDEVAATAQRTLSRTRSIGVALAPCTLPTVGEPNFVVEPGTLEIGMGIHGEPGVATTPMLAADDLVDDLWGRILADAGGFDGEIAVLVNGLGATPLEELYIVFRRVAQLASKAGVRIAATYVGEHATSLEMAGASISVLHLDADLERLLRAPHRSWSPSLGLR